jgi:hypothetical protein
MDALAAAAAIGPQLGTVGAAFYFSAEASARASGIGIDVVSLYAAGRGGVLGNATPADVDEVFFFFKSGLIGSVVEAARASADPSAILEAHIGSAEDYAIATFSHVDPPVLEGFDDAAIRVVEALPVGRWLLVDGYRSVAVSSDPVASAYLRAVVLRELRGGVHREAVESAGLTDSEACQFDQGDSYYRLHGYGDDPGCPGFGRRGHRPTDGRPVVGVEREAADGVDGRGPGDDRHRRHDCPTGGLGAVDCDVSRWDRWLNGPRDGVGDEPVGGGYVFTRPLVGHQ